MGDRRPADRICEPAVAAAVVRGSGPTDGGGRLQPLSQGELLGQRDGFMDAVLSGGGARAPRCVRARTFRRSRGLRRFLAGGAGAAQRRWDPSPGEAAERCEGRQAGWLSACLDELECPSEELVDETIECRASGAGAFGEVIEHVRLQ